jgi:aspartate-semialdehyde dehydrogenase
MSAVPAPLAARLPIDVAVLGATGMVGEQLLALLTDHPWFRVAEVAASERSAGHSLGERLGAAARDLPRSVRELTLQSLDHPIRSPLVLSALPAGAARDIEPRLAGEGRLVVSNASAFRDDPQVPLLVPDVNPDHLELLELQRGRWGSDSAATTGTATTTGTASTTGTPSATPPATATPATGAFGGIITNPNCSVAGVAVALAPLHRRFGIRSMVLTTMQALSGAGRPGPSAADLIDNMIPFIGGEEEKVEREPRKILGTLKNGQLVDADFAIGATCTRVPVLHGHTASVSLTFEHEARPHEVVEVLRDARSPLAGEGLPSAPEHPIVVLDDDDRPQPRIDRDLGGGMTVSVGRVRRCSVHHVRFVVLSHNLVRGAAGAALLNAELAAARGRVPG